MHLSIFGLCVLASTVVSTAITPVNKYVVKESHPVPARWREVERAPQHETLNLRIGLKQERFAELERHLFEVSDPRHPRYGQHLLADEVNAIVAPSDDALDLVHKWLADNGIDASQLTYSSAKDWIKVRLPIAKIERLLNTEYSTFQDDDGDTIFRAPEWSLPIHLHDHIATIQPTNSFMRPRAQNKGALVYDKSATQSVSAPPPDESTLAGLYDPTAVTPTFLRTLYGTINYTVKAADQNKMALNDFLGELNNRSDAELYLEMFRPEAVAAAYQFQQISIDGGTVQQTPENETQLDAGTGIEGGLDLQTMLGVAWPTPLETYSTGGLNPVFVPDAFTTTDSDEPYVAWLEYILALPDSELPTVISTSYGDDEQTIPYSYAAQACGMLAQLGARGVSAIFSSGDEGVGAAGYCYTNDGKNSSTFLPAFPASCPYITSVGATMRFDPEVAVYDDRFSNLFTSGGGFSSYFPQPDYQAAAVDSYLTQYIGDMYEGLYNPGGRGYPDVAAQGSNFSIYWNGTVIPVSGTSASAPLTSAIIALVNDALLAAGRSPLGFLNPWLYSGGYTAFTDITSGSSAGCGTNGFPAEAGWDAVTGFGTPYLPSILENLGLDSDSWSDWQ